MKRRPSPDVGGGRRRPRAPLHLAALLLVATAALSIAPPSVRAQTGGGDAQEGALFLLLPTGAHGVAMGRAMTAMPTHEGVFWNPAGVAEMTRSRLLLTKSEHLAGDAFTVSLLFTDPPVGTLGASYQLLDLGDQDLRDRQGNVLGTVSFRNHVGALTFASPVVGPVWAGVNFKLVQQRVNCRGQCFDQGLTATTFAADIGIQALPLGQIPLRLGAMIAHAGPRLQVVNADQADPLPTRIRLAGAYELAHYVVSYPDVSFWVTVEAEDRWRDPGSPSVFTGGELTVGSEDTFFVRLGYERGEGRENRGAAVGVGVRYERFDLSLAKSLATSITGESEPVHITMALLFD